MAVRFIEIDHARAQGTALVGVLRGDGDGSSIDRGAKREDPARCGRWLKPRSRLSSPRRGV